MLIASLPDNEVHVWRVDLPAAADVLARLGQTLSGDERDRAARFRFAADREAFVACRGALREVLGSYLGAEPASLVFSPGPHGKPALAGAHAGGRLEFNLSHTRGVGLVAVSRRAVGIDVERVRAVPEADAIAARHFSGPERLALAALPPAHRAEAFLSLWTRKEAYVKARGVGLHVPLEGFSVAPEPGDAGAFVVDEGPSGAPGAWRVADVPLEDGGTGARHVGAVARDGRCWRTIVRGWQVRPAEAATPAVAGPGSPAGWCRRRPGYTLR